MSSRYPVAGTHSLLAALLLSALCACGGGTVLQTAEVQLSSQPATTLPRSLSLPELQQELAELPVPDGVDSSVFADLQRELAHVLEARGLDRVASSAPQGAQNQITDLTLVLDAAPEAHLEWTYVNVGDYDQNGEANLADLVPVGLHFGKNSSDPDWDTARLADGDGNGEVNIADITPLGNNFLAQIAEYAVYGGYTADGPWEELATLELAAGSADPALHFSHSLAADDYPVYRVLPFDASGESGQGGITQETLPGPFLDLLYSSVTGLLTGMPADVVFSVQLGPQAAVPSSIQLMELDEAGQQLALLGDMFDDGLPQNGDEAAGDALFSRLEQLEAAEPGLRSFRLRVAYDDGAAERSVLSNTVSIGFVDDITDERIEEILAHMDAVQANLEMLAESMPIEEASQQLLDELLAGTMAADAGLNAEGEGLWWVTDEGIHIVASILDGSKGSSSAELSSLATGNPPARIPTAAGSQQLVAVKGKKVYVLQPFANAVGSVSIQDDVKACRDLLQTSNCPNFEIHEFLDANADYNAFSDSLKADVLLVSSHGVLTKYSSSDTQYSPLVLTGEKVDLPEFRRQLLSLLPALKGSVSFHARRFVVISPSFYELFGNYNSTSLAYFCSDGSLATDLLAKAFLGTRSHAAFLGFPGSAVSRNIEGKIDPAFRILNEMLKGKQVGLQLAAADQSLIPEPYRLKLRGNPALTFAPAQYMIRDIPPLGLSGDNPAQAAFSTAYDVNIHDQVVGRSTDPQGAFTGYLWDFSKYGKLTRIGNLGGINGLARAINDKGQVAGWALDFLGDVQAYIWEDGSITELASLGDNGAATDINNAGLVVGSTDVLGVPFLLDHPCSFSGGGANDLGVFGSGTPSFSSPETGSAFSVSQNGMILGLATDYDNGGLSCFLSSGGGSLTRMPYEFDNLGTMQTTQYRTGRAIDPTGRIVVGSDYLMAIEPGLGMTESVSSYGSKYTNGKISPLFYKDPVEPDAWVAPAGFTPANYYYDVSANAVSADGTIVGEIYRVDGLGFGAYSAFIIFPNGDPHWLEELICDSDWKELYRANAISENGSIVGDGRYRGEDRAFFMRPYGLP